MRARSSSDLRCPTVPSTSSREPVAGERDDQYDSSVRIHKRREKDVQEELVHTFSSWLTSTIGRKSTEANRSVSSRPRTFLSSMNVRDIERGLPFQKFSFKTSRLFLLICETSSSDSSKWRPNCERIGASGVESSVWIARKKLLSRGEITHDLGSFVNGMLDLDGDTTANFALLYHVLALVVDFCRAQRTQE